MAGNAPDSAALSQLFHAVDTDMSGAIDEKELSAICPDLSADEVRYIFGELDVDGDGEITMAEFSDGFKGIRESLLALSRQKDEDREQRRRAEKGGGSGRRPRSRHVRGRARMDVSDGDDEDVEVEVDEGEGENGEADTAAFVGSLDDGFAALTCQEQVCELYQALHGENLPVLLRRFEEIIFNVIRDIRQGQYENERLEKSFKRDKENHGNHLRQLEEEMDAQMQRVENRVKTELQEHHDQEKEQMQSQLMNEIEDLKANLKNLQTLEPQMNEKAGEENKKKLDDVLSENRYLHSQLTDTQTRLALVRSETATLRQNYEEKCNELESEKGMLLQYIKEQDNLTRQVHLLHDANQKLHDTNDDLRAALENYKQKRPHSAFRFDPTVIYVHSLQKTSRTRVTKSSTTPSPKPSTGLPSISKMGSSGDYVQEYLSTPSNNFARCESSLADELNMKPSPASSRVALPSQESCESDSIPEDLGTIVSIDSGHSTMRDVQESDDGELDSDVRPRKKTRKMMPKAAPMDSFDVIDGPDAASSEQEMETDYDTDRQLTASPSSSVSQPSSSHLRPDSAVSNKSVTWKSPGLGRRQLPAIPQIQRPITGEPERMYKIVLCGDAAVGKSSFIMRLCKNRFVNNLSSTLGVDFQTKVLRVDGRIIALQLWDTAGQERFRSIAKSYFRRADGVLLLYDCTYERSFLNIREWIDAVEDGAQKKIPMMIAGNKIDLREQMAKNGKRCISYDDGHRLAREHDALFIETSAKDGDFVQETATEFARLLRTQEDLEVKTVGLQLQDMKNKEDKKLCC